MLASALLDVNLLLALHDTHHVHHRRVFECFDANAQRGWASCPITQNACLRVLSQPSYAKVRTMVELLPALAMSFSGAGHLVTVAA